MKSNNKDDAYRRLSFEEMRRLSEFNGGALASDISHFLKNDPQRNSSFQEWWFARGEPEGKFDLSLKIYQVLNELLERKENVRSLIDLGCNSGAVVYEAMQRGINAVGVDLPLIIDRITLPIKAIAMDLNREFPSGTFDIILCREVFEHVSDADAFWEGCNRIAHRGTILLLSCPYTRRQFENNAFHLRILSRDELRDAIERHGFVAREIFCEHESYVVVAEK
jgi:2-polyprenyl-3-methyl-5-hydroxy-6-metoxy-1,4-benzoquinol methylase